MYRYGLPLGCLLLVLGSVVGGLALMAPAGAAGWCGVGIAALLVYAGIMAIHYFEEAPPPV